MNGACRRALTGPGADQRGDPPSDLVVSEVPEPVNLTAVYLILGPFVLELLHFDREGNAPERRRVFTEPGLTHLSFNVDDLAATCAVVEQHGGAVLRQTELTGVAELVRDPDGQLLELIQKR